MSLANGIPAVVKDTLTYVYKTHWTTQVLYNYVRISCVYYTCSPHISIAQPAIFFRPEGFFQIHKPLYTQEVDLYIRIIHNAYLIYMYIIYMYVHVFVFFLCSFISPSPTCPLSETLSPQFSPLSFPSFLPLSILPIYLPPFLPSSISMIL